MRLRMAMWLVLVCVACGAPSKQTSTVPAGAPPSTSGTTQATDGAAASRVIGPFVGPPGLDFSLRAGKFSEPAPERVRNVAGTPVGDGEVDALLKTLPALPKDASLDVSFAK